MNYDIIIGLEIHAELKTKSKMFCECDNDPVGKEPNQNTCPICLGHPGTLPAPNAEAIDSIVLLGLALKGKINKVSKFDRKNYFYPDLPKGYQISQYDLPFVYDARMRVNGEDIMITRIHLEEDTGKNTHPAGKPYTLVDFNRAGTPLVELVTEPVVKSAEQAKLFCQNYQRVLRYLDLSNADMEKGEMRCEANISLQEPDSWDYSDHEIRPKPGKKLNPKVELKNINSFKAVEKAIIHEIERQKQALSGGGEELVQETRGWDENRGKTVRQRVKETSADYRYFPEPDIPPVRIGETRLKELSARLIELPMEKQERFENQYKLKPEAARLLASERALADYTEQVISELRAWVDSTGDSWERQSQKLANSAANWLTSELFKYLNEHNHKIRDVGITPENMAELITLVQQGKINSSAAKRIFNTMYERGGDPSQLMAELGLELIDDSAELENTVKAVIDKNPGQVEEYKSGKEAVLKFLIGQTMAATKGKANPKKVTEILVNLLKQ